MKISALTSFRVQHGNNSVNFAASNKSKTDTLELSNKKVIPNFVVITPEDYKKGIREITTKDGSKIYTSIVDAEGNQIGEHFATGYTPGWRDDENVMMGADLGYNGWRMYDNGWKITYYYNSYTSPLMHIEGHNENNREETFCTNLQSYLIPNLPKADELHELMIREIAKGGILASARPHLLVQMTRMLEETPEKVKEFKEKLHEIYRDPTTNPNNVMDRVSKLLGFNKKRNDEILAEIEKAKVNGVKEFDVTDEGIIPIPPEKGFIRQLSDFSDIHIPKVPDANKKKK